jgi:hypothetical protein
VALDTFLGLLEPLVETLNYNSGIDENLGLWQRFPQHFS